MGSFVCRFRLYISSALLSQLCKENKEFSYPVALGGRCLCPARGSWRCLPSARPVGHSGTAGVFSPPDTPANSPPPLSLFFSPLLLLLPGAGRGFGGLFFRPPPRGGRCLPGRPRALPRRAERLGCPLPAVQDSTPLFPAQHTPNHPSFILFPRWLAGPLPVTSLLSSSRSSCFHSVQDSLAGGIGSVTPRVSECRRLLFPSSISSAVSKPDTTVFELCKPKYVLEPQKPRLQGPSSAYPNPLSCPGDVVVWGLCPSNHAAAVIPNPSGCRTW